MPSSSSARPSRSRRGTSGSMHSARSSRGSAALQKTQVSINVYDLLPPGRLSAVLWTIGSGLLHSGVVIKGREYAYGGHNRRGVTGVYFTRPRQEPPGGTFRCDVLHGFTYRSEEEVEGIIKEVSDTFLGPSYNLLTHNCNHFTSALCEALTFKPAPKWLNRAASIGLALPCVVPREWIAPPDADTADGELLDEDEEDEDIADERAGMLESDSRRQKREQEARRGGSGGVDDGGEMTPPPRPVVVKDSSGRELPVSERAPVPSTVSRNTAIGM